MDNSTDRLYSEDIQIRNPIADTSAARPNIIYENHEPLLKKYTEPVIDTLYRFYNKNFGRSPYLNNVRVRLEKLPTYWGLFLEKTRRGIRVYIRPVGKVFGYYDPINDRIGIDPIVMPESGDLERKILSMYRMEIPKAKRAISEEKMHRDQVKTGVPERYARIFGRKAAREYLEGAAASISDYLFGETNIYKTWKRRFKNLAGSVGLRRAYSGAF